MISPTAHRSRAWTRQKGGRGGGFRLPRAAGFLAVRAAGRGAVPPRVLVTTVRSRLVADLVVFVDTPGGSRPVERRTYVRYRNPPWHFGGHWPRTRRVAPSSPTSAWRNATWAGAPMPGWSSSTSTPAPSSTRCRRTAGCPSGTRSTRTEAAATPASTASHGRPTTTSGSASGPTSSARSSSRSTPWSACGPSCVPLPGTATTLRWAPTPIPTNMPRASTTSRGASSRRSRAPATRSAS